MGTDAMAGSEDDSEVEAYADLGATTADAMDIA